MSSKIFLSQIIRSCSKEEFDQLVKAYLRIVLLWKEVINSDGPGDGGIDIRVFDDGGRKRQYQLTIQKCDGTQKMKELENKVLADCKKASENHLKLGYERELRFYYSQNLSNETRRRFEKLSRESYGIELSFMDSDDIADVASQYPELTTFILSINPEIADSLKTPKKPSDFNLVYDLVSFGKTADIKKDIVEAYIIQVLFEEGALSTDEIVEKCKSKFHTSEGKSFFERLLNKLYSNRGELIYDKITKTYALTERKKSEVEEKLKQQLEEEHSFEVAIKDALSEYAQDKQYHVYVDCLKELYMSNFNESFNVSVQTDKTKLEELKKLSTKNGVTNVETFIKSLLQVCEDNKYLQKSCASNVFGKQVSLDNLERYAKDNKEIYIDTTIALYLLCYYYDISSGFDLYYYKMAVAFYSFCKKHDIKLHIVERYVWELQRNVSEAISLIPFSNNCYFEGLGGTRNVFYNHYRYISEKEDSSLDYEKYLENYGFFKGLSIYELSAVIQGHLNALGIETVRMRDYDKTIARNTIEDYIVKNNRKKTLFAIDNDAMMMEFLADEDSEVHPMDPVFITWDKTFFEVRDDFFSIKPFSHRWMQFVPNQFVDRYSLLTFSINEETITKEMLAIITDDIVKQTRTLADAISSIISPVDKVGLQYTRRLAELRESMICNNAVSSDFPQAEGSSSTLADVFFGLIEHYRGDSKFEALFRNEDLIDDVMDVIRKAANEYSSSHGLDNSIYDSIDKLLTQTVL